MQNVRDASKDSNPALPPTNSTSTTHARMVEHSLAFPRSLPIQTAFAAHQDLALMDCQHSRAQMTSKCVTIPRSPEMTIAHDAHRELMTQKPITHA